MAFVQTRRVLFSTYTNEVPEECPVGLGDSQLPHFLSDVIGSGGIATELLKPLRLMRLLRPLP